MFSRVPHIWLCEGKLLCLEDPRHADNQSIFEVCSHFLLGSFFLFIYFPVDVDRRACLCPVSPQIQWSKGHPVIVANVHTLLNMDLWTPASISKEFGDREDKMVDCRNGDVIIGKPLNVFWAGFQDLNGG